MAVDRRHLRHISRNYYGPAGPGLVAAVGAVVPLGRRRYLFFVRVWHNSPAPQRVNLFRDGGVGAVPLDICFLPGSGLTIGYEIGSGVVELAKNVETPIYMLESGQTLGIGSPAATTSYILACGYDEP